MKKVRLGIIGNGAQGGTYAGFIAEGKVKNIEISAICDIDPAKKPCVPKNIQTCLSMITILICLKAAMSMPL
ncbi:MAG TPA: hypothetical protein VEY51_18420 [Chondromyces sp.]|nr:hypothetical protein [Chondromyces sp.]